jgi:predicted regulator of Ras-like GTPase activity (Roadblock/LC7/MglB family)
MVFKNIARIRTALPEVENIVMFYSNGTIFQTTFPQEFNIPKLGENLAASLNHMKTLYELIGIEPQEYTKMIFETDEMSIMILKLGEDSNIALFFKKEEDRELRIGAIRRYIAKIEDLIDVDRKELIFREILSKEDELNKLEEQLRSKQEHIEELKRQASTLDPKDQELEMKKLEKDWISLESDYTEINKLIDKLFHDINDLKSQIEKK